MINWTFFFIYSLDEYSIEERNKIQYKSFWFISNLATIDIILRYRSNKQARKKKEKKIGVIVLLEYIRSFAYFLSFVFFSIPLLFFLWDNLMDHITDVTVSFSLSLTIEFLWAKNKYAKHIINSIVYMNEVI